MIPRFNLEHWAVLQAVVEQGGFAQAGDLCQEDPQMVEHLEHALDVAADRDQGRSDIVIRVVSSTESGGASARMISPSIRCRVTRLKITSAAFSTSLKPLVSRVRSSPPSAA